MIPWGWLVVFDLGDRRYGLPLHTVDRVVRAVHITPLPQAPDVIRGIVNVAGTVIAVANIGHRFGLPERELGLSDQIIIAHTSRRPIALLVEAVSGVLACTEQDSIAARRILPGMEWIAGVVKLADGLILIHDLDSFLSLEEETELDEAIEHERGTEAASRV
jgi:purine-binding chemotaxis protein CheW